MYTEVKNAPGGFVVAFRDRDGHAEVMERFGTVVYQEGKAGGATGVYGDALYVEVDDTILRYPLSRESLVFGSKRGTRPSTETYKSSTVANQAELAQWRVAGCS